MGVASEIQVEDVTSLLGDHLVCGQVVLISLVSQPPCKVVETSITTTHVVVAETLWWCPGGMILLQLIWQTQFFLNDVVVDLLPGLSQDTSTAEQRHDPILSPLREGSYTKETGNKTKDLP